MIEKPILFNGEMVRAVLDGRKTQTRRVIKPSGNHEIEEIYSSRPNANVFMCGCDCDECRRDHTHSFCLRSPYGSIGDQLWVRETFAIECNADLQDVYTEPENPVGPVKNIVDGEIEYFECPRYRASEPDTILGDDGIMRWKPSIFMPRWASRIQLEVTDVRVERVQDITEEGARAEGVDGGCLGCGNSSLNKSCGCDDPNPDFRDSFIHLWQSINEKRGFGWLSDAFVWVVKFEVVKD